MAQRLLRDLPKFDEYAGLQIVASGIEVDLVGAPSSDVIAAIAEDQQQYLGTSIPVPYRQVERTEKQLESTKDRVFNDREQWASKNINLASWGPDVPSNTVVIRLEHYTADAEEQLVQAYGTNVSVLREDSPELPSVDRTHDIVAWYGGDLVNISGHGSCTTYFSLYSVGNGEDYNAIAGHCGLGIVTNAGFPQGSADAARLRWTNGGSTDVVVYPVPGNYGRVWADPTTAYRNVTIRATADPVGTLLCTDGATDREVCSVQIGDSDDDSTYGGKTIHHQVRAFQQLGHPAFSAGDSGGPVYAGRNGIAEAQAFGMIVSMTPNPATGHYTPLRYIFAAYSNLTFKPYS